MINDLKIFASHGLSSTLFAATVVSVAVFIVYLLGSVIYNRSFHPLAKYPGPFLWSIFRWPYVLSLVRGNFVHDVKKLHDQYGPVIRLAPNELSYIEPHAWKDIYGYQKNQGPEFPKNPIWAHESPNGVKSIIDAEYEAHVRMRKPLLHAFSPRALKSQEGLMQGYITNLITRFKDLTASGKGSAVVNLRDYYNWTTFDIIGDLGFGEPFDCLKGGAYHPWVSFLYGHLKAGALLAACKFYPPIAAFLLWITPQSAFERAKEHFQMSCNKLDRRMALKTDRRDLISYILEANESGGMSLKELQATSALIILAGSESTSSCLMATTNLLLRFPEKLQKLSEEIRTTFKSDQDISSEALESLPYLKAVFQEGLRMAPPVPIAIPRVVPSIGATVCGEYLPPDTFVGIPQFAAYRYKDYFKFPDQFIPERWLPEDSDLNCPSPSDPSFSNTTFAHDAKKLLQPFSVGPRDCVGKGLGIMEMRLVMAHLLWNFDLVIPDQATVQNEEDAFRDFESQKTYALWERLPLNVEIMPRTS